MHSSYFFSCFFAVLLVLFAHKSFGQTVSGTVKDDLGNLIPVATLVIKEKDSTGRIITFARALDGSYQFNLQEKYKAVYIKISAYGHVGTNATLLLQANQNNYSLNFVLQQAEIKELQEVVVAEEAYGFIEKEDTVSYNAEKYKQEGDRKLEDLLKNLPGVEVDPTTGTIKYMGKQVKTVTIDGTNLFDQNYTLATRNINIDIIDQIEAINNYNENEIIGAIQESGDVALNVKLKENRTDLSGSITGIMGYREDPKVLHSLNGSALAIRKNFKSFVNLSTNNIGTNWVPSSIYSTGNIGSNPAEIPFRVKDLMNLPALGGAVGSRRQNFNNQKYGSTNTVINITRALELKVNFNAVRDALFSINTEEAQGLFGTDTITFSNILTNNKSPELLQGAVQLRLKKPSAIWQYNLSGVTGNITNRQDIVANQVNALNANTFKRNNFYNQRLTFTKKLKGTKAFQFKVSHAHNFLEENLNIQPSTLDTTANPGALTDNQLAIQRKTTLQANASLIGANPKGSIHYTINTGVNSATLPLESTLSQTLSEQQATILAANDVSYTGNRYFTSANASFFSGPIKVTPKLDVSVFQQSYQNELRYQEQANVVLQPGLDVRYILGSQSYITASAGQNARPLAESYLANNIILTGNRSLIQNTTSLDLQTSRNYVLTYANNNLYRGYNLSASINHSTANGQFLQVLNFSENFDALNFLFQGLDLSSTSARLRFDVYVPALTTNVAVYTALSQSRYFNFVNDGDLRENQNETQSYQLELSFNPSVTFNLEQVLVYNRGVSSSSNGPNYINESIASSSALNYRPFKELSFKLAAEIFRPNLNTNVLLDFYDFIVSYQPNQWPLLIEFSFTNMANTNAFTVVDPTDYAVFTRSVNLVPRGFILSVEYSF